MKTFQLNNGELIPAVGFGVFQINTGYGNRKCNGVLYRQRAGKKSYYNR